MSKFQAQDRDELYKECQALVGLVRSSSTNTMQLLYRTLVSLTRGYLAGNARYEDKQLVVAFIVGYINKSDLETTKMYLAMCLFVVSELENIR